jgi:hypothetical protein
MPEQLQLIVNVAAGVTVLAGTIGGLWSLFDRAREAWRKRHKLGYGPKSLICCATRKVGERYEADVLVAGDLWALLRTFLQNPGVELKSIAMLGQYPQVTLYLPSLDYSIIGERR